VLALVALFTGAFLVFSVLSLSVARRTPQLALLGVLGLGARERQRLVLLESALQGALGAGLVQHLLVLLRGRAFKRFSRHQLAHGRGRAHLHLGQCGRYSGAASRQQKATARGPWR